MCCCFILPKSEYNYLRITSYYSIYWFEFRYFALKDKNRQLSEPLCNLIKRRYIDKDKKFPFFNFWNGSLARTILWWILWTFLECLRDLSPNHRLFKHIEARSGWVCSWMQLTLNWPTWPNLTKPNLTKPNLNLT